MDKGQIDRREFLKNSALAALFSTITVRVVGCEGEKYAISLVEEADVEAADDTAAETTATKKKKETADDEGDDAAAPPPGPAPKACTTVDASISNPHGHTAKATAAQQEAGNAVTITLTEGGGDNHTHKVSLSGAEVSSLCDGATVVKTSTEDSFHTHTVTFSG